MTSAVVVGSGPNGLAAAIKLARAGVRVTVVEAADEPGGGARSSTSLTVPGLLHDHCSAVHPLGIGSPYFRSLGLERHGLEWAFPEIDFAHPLDGGRAGVFVRSVADTAAGLGADGPVWRRLFGRLGEGFDEVAPDFLGPLARLPRHPLLLGRLGLSALAPATLLARAFRGDEARALFAGCAAHATRPLTSPASSAAGVALIAAGHRHGWPVARGGSAAIVRALLAELAAHGGRVETGRRVTDLREVGGPDGADGADIVLLNVSPPAAADLAGDRLPPRVRRAYRRYRFGPSSFKLDLAVEGGVPWLNESVRRAGTVHLGGTIEQLTRAEAECAAGRMPERPYVLVAQQYLADPSRSVGDVHPVWAYAHVPHGYPGDATQAILDQLERFAPGTRERIVAQHARGPAGLQSYNANYVGGDIATGANDIGQLLTRPRTSANPYRTGIPGVYLCSAATPPGAGVHGMCGANAADAALRDHANGRS